MIPLPMLVRYASHASWIVDEPGRAESDRCFDGFLAGKCYLIHDRDRHYAAQFTKTLRENLIQIWAKVVSLLFEK